MTIESLEIEFLMGRFPTAQALLTQHSCTIGIKDNVLTITCADRLEAVDLRDNTYQEIAGCVNAAPQQFMVEQICYRWPHGQIKLPLVDRLWLRRPDNNSKGH